MTRVTMLGELTTSIAHEVSQPLSAVIANAEACLRWLDLETPDLTKARRSVEWVVRRRQPGKRGDQTRPGAREKDRSGEGAARPQRRRQGGHRAGAA